jgi:ABC-type branched-subunit amino acid transport system substrate-binding protein
VRGVHVRLATAAAVLAAMLTLVACGSDESPAGPQRLDLKIGNLISRTGPLAQFGQPAQQAGDLAADEIRKGAAKAGARHKVTITHVDVRSEPKAAQELAGKLVDRGSSCLVGPWGGGPTVRVAKQVSIPRKVVQISPSASGDAFTKAEDRGYLFRVVPPDRLQADALAELLDDRLRGARGKKVNVGALKSRYGNDLMEAFEDAWTGKGGRIGRQETYRVDQPTFGEQAKSLASGDPDAWVFFDFIETYTRMASDLSARKEADFSPRKAFATDSLASSRATIAPLASNGLRGVAIGAPKQGQAPEEFEKRFTARGPAKRQTFDAQEFDAVVLCYLSAVAAGSTKGEQMADKVREVSAPPGRKFTWLQLDQAVKALEAGQDIDYDGASGPIEMNDDGDPTAGVYDVYEFRGGKLRLREQIAVPDRPGGI